MSLALDTRTLHEKMNITSKKNKRMEGYASRDMAFSFIMQTLKNYRKWHEIIHDLPQDNHTKPLPDFLFASRLYHDFFRNFPALQDIADKFLTKKSRIKDYHFFTITLMIIAEYSLYNQKEYVLKSLYLHMATQKKCAQRKAVFTAMITKLYREKPFLQEKYYPIMTQWKSFYGVETAKKIHNSIEKRKYIDIYVTSQQAYEDISHSHKSHSFHAQHLRIYDRFIFEEEKYFQEGSFWVQNISAQQACLLLYVKEHEKVLDIGAAPGGKTLFFCDKSRNVTALDKSNTRIKKLRQNINRCHFKAHIIEQDFLKLIPQNNQKYDKIMLDAPCSAIGTLAKNPELAYITSYGDVLHENLYDIQYRLLKAAWHFLKKDGLLIYTICSFDPREGQDIIAKVCHENLFTCDPIKKEELCVSQSLNHDEKTVTLFPFDEIEYGGLEGFFMARLRKVSCEI